MRSTEIVIFIVVMLVNGAVALYKKKKERDAKRALEQSSTGRGSASAQSATQTRSAPPISRAPGGAEAIDGRVAQRKTARNSDGAAQPQTSVKQSEQELFNEMVAAEKKRIEAQARLDAARRKLAEDDELRAQRAKARADRSKQAASSSAHSLIHASKQLPLASAAINSRNQPRPSVRGAILPGILKNRKGLRHAVLLTEILGPPRCQNQN